MKILFLEDQPSLIADAREFLLEEGHDVFLAQFSRNIDELLSEHGPFDVLFCDIKLHETEHVNGLHVAKRFIKDLKTPVVVYSNFASESVYFKEAKEMGIPGQFFAHRDLLRNQEWLLSVLSEIRWDYPGLYSRRLGSDEPFILSFPEDECKGCIVLTALEIAALIAIPGSYTALYHKNGKEPVVQTASLIKVYSYLNAKVGLGHLAKMNTSGYIDLSFVSEFSDRDGFLKVFLKNGASFTISKPVFDLLKQNWPHFRVSIMKNEGG